MTKSVRAVVFDIGGVLEVPTDTDLEADVTGARRLGMRAALFQGTTQGSPT